MFIEVLRDHIPRKRIEMFLVLEEDNRKKGIHRRGNEQEEIYSRRNPPRIQEP